MTNLPFAALNGNGYISWGNWGSFTLTSSPGVGNTPEGICAADVNGDGHVDLISANEIANTLTVLTNNGYGVFGSNATLNVGRDPSCVIAADVNGDGHVDLICANTSDNTVTVLTNNGYGVFGSNATLNVGNFPQCVCAADVNGDGHVDLISANVNDSTLTVLTNNGFGVFGSNATLNVGSGPPFVCAADVNGDGHVDLISENYGANTLSVLLNNVPAYYGTGSGLTSLSAANLTGTIADGLLSANVALRAGGNAFTGNQTVTSGKVGIASTSPEGLLEIQGGADGSGANDQHDIALAYRNGGYRHWIRTRHSSIVSGNPSDNAIDFFVNNSTSSTGSSAPGTGSLLVMSLNSGNVGIDCPEPTHLLQVSGAVSPAYCDGPTWVNGSDRNSKEAFTAIDPRKVLDKVSALPITEWQYKVEADGTRHLGPVAQDFHAAFGLNGADDKHIATIDEEGVALAAIQGLNQKLEKANAELKAQNDSFARQLNELATEVKAMEQKR